MSEVKRYHVTETGLVEGESLGRLSVVLAADFDRVTAERDALQDRLNESDELCSSLERSMKNHRHELGLVQQRLTAADELVCECTASLLECGSRCKALERSVHVLEGLLANAYETAAKWVEKRMDDYVNEHGSEDPETGSLELPGTGDEYVCELMEIADGLRALKPAEGGGDDTTLEEDREDFKKVFVRINTKQGQSISLSDMIARYEKKP